MTTPTPSTGPDPMRAVRELVETVAEQGRQIRRLERSADLGRASIDSGALVVKSAAGQEALRIGEHEDGTTVVQYVAGPTPATPSAPRVVTTPGGTLVVTWDGRLLGDDGAEQGAPADFLHVLVYVSEDQTPDAADDFDSTTAEMVGVITSAGGGSKTIGRAPGRYEVRLVAVSRSGMESLPSDPVEADIERLVDAPDLAGPLGDLDERLATAGDLLEENEEKLATLQGRFTFSDREPGPDDAVGRAEGSVWTMLTPGVEDGTTVESGRWQLRAGEWEPMGLDPTVIPELLGYLATFQQVNVGQLVATEAAMQNATVLKLFAELFAAKKITAGEMVITNTQNLVLDGYYSTPSAWANIDGGPGSGFVTTPTTGDAARSVRVTQRVGAQATQTIYSANQDTAYYIPVKAGEAYLCSVPVRSTGPLGNALGVHLRAYFYDATRVMIPGGNLKVAEPAGWTEANTWVDVAGQVVVPAGAVYMSLRPTVYYPADTAPTNTTEWFFGPLTCYRATDASLVVNGSIRAAALEADAVFGKKVGFVGTGTGTGYDITMDKDGEGGLVLLAMPGASAAGSIRTRPAEYGVVGGLMLKSPTTTATPKAAEIRIAPGTTAAKGLVWIDGRMHISGGQIFLSAASTEVQAGDLPITSGAVTWRATSFEQLATSGNAKFGHMAGANVEATSTGNLWINAGGGAALLANGGDQNLRAFATYNNTSTAAANVYINPSGWLYRSTSRADAKIYDLPVTSEHAEKLLDVPVRTWIDRGDAERMAEYEHLLHLGVLGEEDTDRLETLSTQLEVLDRHAGVFAEDVEAAGLPELVVYNENASGHRVVEGVAYDRIGPYLIAVVKAQRERIRDLEHRAGSAEERLVSLEATVAALVAASSK